MNNLSTSIKTVLRDATTFGGGYKYLEVVTDLSLTQTIVILIVIACLRPIFRDFGKLVIAPTYKSFFGLLRDMTLDRISNRLSDKNKKHLEKHRLREDAIANNAITPPEPPNDEPKKDEKPPEEKPSDSNDAPSE